ncbi:hypothetical protein [Streptomyces sp. NPDC020298]|uniref:hypothetical protein n=1 Tax=unclassified Streptomyces TaxID=2593676 RepID=UPI0033F4756C
MSARNMIKPDTAAVVHGFAQPGRIYTRQCHGVRAEFDVRHVSERPDGGWQAFGWYRRQPRTSWHPYSQDTAEFELSGWTEVAEGGEGQ